MKYSICRLRVRKAFGTKDPTRTRQTPTLNMLLRTDNYSPGYCLAVGVYGVGRPLIGRVGKVREYFEIRYTGRYKIIIFQLL